MKKTDKIFTEYSFPVDFLWGASTAGHQVEGGNYDQWTVYELDNASELATGAESRLKWLPDWQKFKPLAQNPENYVSGKGVDHYRRYKEDFRIIKKLNLNSFRFGIEWSRIEPTLGQWNQEAIDHYHTYIRGLKAMGIEPIVNLWHWTHPVWFEAMGGFSKAANIKHFVRFVEKIATEYGDDIKYILTINEPNVYSSFSFLTGEWPPNHRSRLRFLKVFYNLAKAHNSAYKTIKANHPHMLVGPATQFGNAQPKRHGKWLDMRVAKLADYVWNWWWVDRIKRHTDFLGFNYYFTDYYQGFHKVNPPSPHNDLGWYMDPAGLADVLLKASQRYDLPLMVTENGVADQDDK
ncbi:glycoside hydrolase family 1 protein, partial [Candidatus Saccharibacteria bacterium]|nr:glycoside hydrolase family 1 protein [Candidatus Saccharibacteria bacterium]